MNIQEALAITNKCLEQLGSSQRITLNTEEQTGIALIALADSYSKVLLEQKQYELIVEIGEAQLTIAQYYNAKAISEPEKPPINTEQSRQFLPKYNHDKQTTKIEAKNVRNKTEFSNSEPHSPSKPYKPPI